MNVLASITAFSLVVLGIAVALDPSLRIWLRKPRRLKLTLEHAMDLVVGHAYLLTVSGLNVTNGPAKLTVVPAITISDPALADVTPAPDGLTAQITILAPGTFVLSAHADEPTGACDGTLSAASVADNVPVKLLLEITAVPAA